MYKIKLEMDKDMLFLAYKMIKEIFVSVPVEKLFDFLKEFTKKYVLEGDMKESVITLSNLTSVKKSIMISKTKKKPRKIKSESVNIENKKFLNRLRENRDFESAIESMAISINEQLKLQSKLTKEKVKPFVDEINAILQNAKDNVPVNRNKRIDSERNKKEMENEKINAKKREVGERLHNIFMNRKL